jgi:type II secretory pathway pseudopilin PulG
MGKKNMTYGFGLPVLLIVSTVMMAVFFTTLSSIVATRNTLQTQNYTQLAERAAESGIEKAKACLAKNSNVITWTNNAPLRPDTDCNGAPASGVNCSTIPRLDRCGVLVSDLFFTSFSVGLPTTSSGAVVAIAAQGTTNLVRQSDNQVWRTFTTENVQFQNVPDGPPPPVPVNMTDLTWNYCLNNMTVYNGSNPSAILTLHDSRAEGQDYEVARLPGDYCMMIENLRLGSTSGSTLLTPSDTNITQNWTLPQLNTAVAALGNVAQAYSAPPGDTGSSPSATNYGYQYNYCAAIAGGIGGGGGSDCVDPAVYPMVDICAKGWRLPAIIGSYSDLPSLSDWSYNGPFKGVRAGYSTPSSKLGSGTTGYWWTVNEGYIGWMFSIGSSGLSLGALSTSYGISLRCVLA